MIMLHKLGEHSTDIDFGRNFQEHSSTLRKIISVLRMHRLELLFSIYLRVKIEFSLKMNYFNDTW